MRIGGSIPFHVARAYGVSPTRPAARAERPDQPTPVAPPENAATPSRNLQQLIAGIVPGRVDFSSPMRNAAANGAYALYDRAADKIEAVVGVHVGRAIDLKG